MKYSTVKTMFINCYDNKKDVKQLLNNRLELLKYITDTKNDYKYELKWLKDFEKESRNYEISVDTIKAYNIEIIDLIQYYNSKYNDNIKTDLTII